MRNPSLLPSEPAATATLADRRVFEGPVLDDVLDRVRRECGPGAEIVAAHKVRRGGIGGFFAREHFEVVVAAGEPAGGKTPGAVGGDAAAGRPTGGPRTIEELADAINEVERRCAPTSGTAPPPAHSRGHHQHQPPAGWTPLAPERIARTDGRPLRTGQVAAVPRVSTESDGFAAVLARIARETGAPLPDDAHAETGATHAPDAIDLTVEEQADRLLRLGLPARYVPRRAETTVRAALVERLAALPAAPALPRTRGAVLAVVGAPATTIPVARAMLADLGGDPDELVVASPEPLGRDVPAWLVVTDASAAAERRLSWRRRERSTVVAVPYGRHAPVEWAAEMLTHLEPTLVWAVVEAARKPEDIAHLADRLGGVDALALTGLDDTASPATALHGDIPVGRLGDQPATPDAWADLLLERIR